MNSHDELKKEVCQKHEMNPKEEPKITNEAIHIDDLEDKVMEEKISRKIIFSKAKSTERCSHQFTEKGKGKQKAYSHDKKISEDSLSKKLGEKKDPVAFTDTDSSDLIFDAARTQSSTSQDNGGNKFTFSVFSVNTQVVTSTSIAVALLYLVRLCHWTVFVCCVAIPGLLYALLAERTKATQVAGKTLLVTGGSSGLGLEIAKEAAKRGAAKVILMSRTRKKLEAAAKLCETTAVVAGNKPFEAMIVPCDLSSLDAVREAVKLLPPVDILVNNAGAGAWKHIEDTSPEEAVKMMACPYQSMFAMTSLLVPTMIARAKDCHVLNVTSAASMLGLRGAVAYGSARWAVRGFSRMLKQDLKEYGIGVTLLNPAEITGTSYFTANGGHDRIPALFQMVDKIGLNYSAAQVASAALDGVEKGWSNIDTPGHVMIPTKMLIDTVPCFVEFLCTLGSAGLRTKDV